MYQTYNYNPTDIWKMDKSGTQGERGVGKILARVRIQSMHSLIPNERGLLTVLLIINAIGETIPNFYILKRF